LLRNNPEERTSHLLRGGSLKSRNWQCSLTMHLKGHNSVIVDYHQHQMFSSGAFSLSFLTKIFASFLSPSE
jgi:hypothetical protein